MSYQSVAQTKVLFLRWLLRNEVKARALIPPGRGEKMELPLSHGVHMPTLQEQIAEKFLAKLTESKDVDAEKIDHLRTLLADRIS